MCHDVATLKNCKTIAPRCQAKPRCSENPRIRYFDQISARPNRAPYPRIRSCNSVKRLNFSQIATFGWNICRRSRTLTMSNLTSIRWLIWKLHALLCLISTFRQSWPKLCGTSLQNALPRPSISFSHGNQRSLGQILLPPIYHSQRESTVVRFRDVFKNQQIKFRSASECRRWQAGPNWRYWPQQLNLATWCATGGCGVTVDWNDFPPEVRNLLKFHVIFTVRRLLYEMGCALPDDTGFDQINNPHDLAAIERIKREFNGPSDFRNKRGSNGVSETYKLNSSTRDARARW